MQLIAFAPQGPSVSISASTTSANVALASGGGNQIYVHNAGTTLAFIELGLNSAVTATSTSTPVPAGAVIIFTKLPGHTHLAAILASGTGTIYAQVGGGL